MTRGRIDLLTRRSVLHGLLAAGAGAAGLSACSGEAQTLNLAIWQDYLGETTLADFRRATGIEVAVSTYADNAQLYARLKGGDHGFDLVVPSSAWVERLIREKLIQPLSAGRIANLTNLEPAFAEAPYDPGYSHSVPYTWLALGIGYRRSKFPQPPQGWKALLSDPRLAGRLSLPGDPGLLFRIAAKALGFPANQFNPERLALAEALLAGAMPRVKVLHGDGGQDLLLRGEVDAVAVWNGDLAQVALEDPDIAFVTPAEGALLSADCLCIPAGARHPGNAHQLIDFLLSPEGGAGVAGTLWFPSPNAAARDLLPPNYRGDPVLYPPPRPGAQSEWIGDNPGLEQQFAAALPRLAGKLHQSR